MIEEFRISSSTIPKDVFFGLVVDGGKAITLSELGILVQDRAGSLKLVTKAPFDIGKPQLRSPRCDPNPSRKANNGVLLSILKQAQKAERNQSLVSRLSHE